MDETTDRRSTVSSARRWLGGAGLTARGGLFVVIGLITLQVAFGDHGADPDGEGALTAVARQPFGWTLLLLLALGFAGYALWRSVKVFVGGGHDEEGPTWTQRAANAGRALVYGALLYTTVQILVRGRADSEEESQITARIMEWPGGRVLVAAAGIAAIGVGLAQARRAVDGSWRDAFDLSQCSERVERAVTVLATVGLVARLVVFAAIGFFVVRAAWQFDPNEAVGVDGALLRLVDTRFGPVLLAGVAAGFFAYGAYSFAEARYRRADSG